VYRVADRLGYGGEADDLNADGLAQGERGVFSNPMGIPTAAGEAAGLGAGL